MSLSFLKQIAAFVILTFSAWGALELLGILFTYNSLLPVWAMALIISTGITAIIVAYKKEAALVSQKKAKLLTGLRILSFVIVAFMLMQPVLIRTVSRKIERAIAVLVDTSDSMRHTDTDWTPSEQLSLAYEKEIIDQSDMPLPSLEPLSKAIRKLEPWLKTEITADKKPAAYKKLLKTSSRLVKELQDETDDFIKEIKGKTPGDRSDIDENSVTNALITLAQLQTTLKRLSTESGLTAYHGQTQNQDQIFTDARKAADTLFWHTLPTNTIAQVTAYTSTNRLALAASILEKTYAPLAKDYDLTYFSLGRRLKTTSFEAIKEGQREESQATATDYATALESLLTAMPTEKLAGILILTDGLNNGEAAVEPIARQLGARSVHASTLLIGSTQAPRDLAIADIEAPESIFLGDKVRVKTEISAEGARGEEAVVSLLLNGEKVDEEKIPISEDSLRRTISLSHSPTNSGITRYELKIDHIAGERFPSNNTWRVDVAVSDDRTNVLLIDDFPRWDFRYLRNLFYGRDKSVHLQYYLHHPDSIADITLTNKPPAASASRKFGDAEAGALPESEEEWRAFDTIILGDVGPDLITPEIQQIIRKSVEERGTLLVTIAGPRAMPHAYTNNATLSEIMPCVIDNSQLNNPELRDGGTLSSASVGGAASCRTDTEPNNAGPHLNSQLRALNTLPKNERFSVKLTPSGQIHPVMQQSASAAENEEIWNSIPKFSWRQPVIGIKAGAEILAYADFKKDNDDAAITAENAIEKIKAEKRLREERSLIVVQSAGKGKVVQLNTDESWRLRYRTGDTRHHRFWGQIIKWGLSERLRQGNERLRIGTDKITYTPNDPVRIIARLRDENSKPITDASITAVIEASEPAGAGAARELSAPLNGQEENRPPVPNSDEVVTQNNDTELNNTPELRTPNSELALPKSLSFSVKLTPLPDSEGLYEAILPPFEKAGPYKVTIENSAKYSGTEEEIATHIFIAAARKPIEMAKVKASCEVPQELAGRTGGRVVMPHEAKELLKTFGEKSRVVHEEIEIAVWDNKWLLILLLASLITEWIIRKKSGLV